MASTSAHLDRAATALGSQHALACAAGVTDSCVWQWRLRRPVPLDRCIQIEAATRRVAGERQDPTLVVCCEDLRPDVPWRVLRENPFRRDQVDAALERA
jgi:DNA-binding transcriptional regulator YdaS (Cro superfamily)